MIPTIFHVNSDGNKRYMSDRKAIEAVLEAVHRGQEIATVEGITMQIKEQIRTDDVWTVEIVL